MKLKQKLATRYTRAQLNILSLVSLRKSAEKAFRLFITPGKRRKGKLPPIFETGEPLSIRLDGHSIRGHRWQPYSDALRPSAETAPKKVLIAHGFGSASRVFEHYIAALLKKGYEVVAFDAPGHGQSGGKRLFISDYVRMLSAIETSFGPFHSWMAHSLGGLALALSLEDMETDGECRLVLVAPAPGVAPALEEWAAELELPVPVVREIGEYAKEISGHPLDWYSLRRVVGTLGAEILYVQDEGDSVISLDEAALIRKDGHPNIRFHFTTGLGHKKVYKDQEVLDQIVGFL
ncbi:MAG TPA: alpha/beta fold hydrolase [Puia sp.]|jgi:pimeloyl-ACP methyl ester carboxylesterase|nr:alpha/beta fold hydrolase [Puia sp.]